MSRYLVTGGAGFIGCNLVRYVLRKGHQVVVLDNFATGKRQNLADLAGKIDLIEGDIRDRAAVDGAMRGCAAVFHQAALGSVPRSVADPVTTHDANVNGTVTVLESARAAGVMRVVFAASSSAYGEQPASPKHEGMAATPISPYAASKLACEAYMQAYASAYGMQTLSLRYFNVFGPHQDPQGAYAAVIPAFVAAILQGRRPVVYGDGEQSRDFCYIDNVCEANWLAAHAAPEACKGQPLNIACNHATSLNQMLAQLGELLGAKVQASYELARTGDVKHSLADISLARRTIGYEPKVFFEQGLAKAIEWYKANL
jgi:nucleoside-diphosphate-sugar epimerase